MKKLLYILVKKHCISEYKFLANYCIFNKIQGSKIHLSPIVKNEKGFYIEDNYIMEIADIHIYKIDSKNQKIKCEFAREIFKD